MTKTVLITGGLGYIGGRVALRVHDSGRYNLRIATRRRNISPPSWLHDAEVITMDVLAGTALDRVCEGVDCIVHLAALNEHECIADPQSALLVNGLGTLKLLQAAQRQNVNRFLYVSTAHIYGSPLQGRIDEASVPRPTHPYAITHRVAEDFVLAAHTQRDLTGIVLRMSNGFGAPAHADVNRWTLLVNDLCRQATQTGKIVMRSAGLEQRDFISLDDVSRAIVHVMDLPRESVADGLFNLGGNCSMRAIDVAQLVGGRCEVVLGSTPPIERPAPTGKPPLDLDYRSDKLIATGFRHSGSMINEIDATLRLCKAAFGTQQH